MYFAIFAGNNGKTRRAAASSELDNAADCHDAVRGNEVRPAASVNPMTVMTPLSRPATPPSAVSAPPKPIDFQHPGQHMAQQQHADQHYQK